MDCLTDIIGIIKEETPCITGGLTPEQIADLKKSNSDRYLDDLPGGVHLKELKYIDTAKSMYDLAILSKNEAINHFDTDLLLGISERYKDGRTTYRGEIGQRSFTSTLPAGRKWRGIRIRPVDQSDAQMTLITINVIFNITGTVPLHIYRVPKDSVQGEVIETFNINCIANNYATYVLPTPLVLPFMTPNYMSEVEYYFLYDADPGTGAFQPKDNKLNCPSCQQKAAHVLAEYADIYGVTLNDPQYLNDKSVDVYSQGIILTVDMRCTTDKLFCREYDNNNAIARAMSYAVWYKAGGLLTQYVRKSPDVNRLTMMNDEQLRNRAAHFESQYGLRLQYIIDAIDVKSSNCYVCRQVANVPVTGGIFS